MNWFDLDTGNCSIQRTLDVVGDRWTLLVCRDAAHGVRRFDEFRRHLGVSEPVLADRLRKLVAAGVLETRPYRAGGQRSRLEYLLTDQGWELYPALIALLQWGDRHLADPTGPSLTVRHQKCGHPVEAVVRCTHDHEVVGPREAASAPGPGARTLDRGGV